mmetsp:Transcript_4215/g.7155  ORF Transcript_4215/g.7155 Transcript_4215/m.7155 type:complete len:125 (+) Transcript_4215:465-839(+)
MMLHQYNAYQFQVVKQQLFKFYQDKHIKVSLFITDKIQGLDGTIYLNFVGQNPIYTPKKSTPGTVTFIKTKKTKQIKLLHSDKTTPNPFETRVEGSTQPWLGSNLYAADRKPPVIPWRPEESVN